METKVVVLEMVQAARKTGGDKFEVDPKDSNREAFMNPNGRMNAIYLPQQISRQGETKPAAAVKITIEPMTEQELLNWRRV